MTILPGDPPVQVALNRMARARRLSLRVSRLDGRVTLSMPANADESLALDFLRDRESWLRGALAGVPGRAPVAAGGEIMLRGAPLTLQEAPVRAATLRAHALLLPPDPAGTRSGARVAAWLKLQARGDLGAACERFAAQLGKVPGQLVLGDPRGRWGSCSSRGRLMFSWRLVMAPPEVLTYVAAHEVAHLVEMNHSPAFWGVVARLMPDHAAPRTWLRDNGHRLHRFDFGGSGGDGAGAKVDGGKVDGANADGGRA
ncbi:MAG: M48 family metallopeptidase [Rhodobacteraceae bacterium]|nr:M48 family metallopeptidase [Paracoccaceae bacterium]